MSVNRPLKDYPIDSNVTEDILFYEENSYIPLESSLDKIMEDVYPYLIDADGRSGGSIPFVIREVFREVWYRQSANLN